jgi:hypothetical protein
LVALPKQVALSVAEPVALSEVPPKLVVLSEALLEPVALSAALPEPVVLSEVLPELVGWESDDRDRAE